MGKARYLHDKYGLLQAFKIAILGDGKYRILC
jgi:hypothetical protein